MGGEAEAPLLQHEVGGMAGRRAYSLGRLYERTRERIPVTIIWEVGGSRVHEDGTTIDISRGGARVRITAPLVPGQAVEIASQGSAKLGRVVWVGQSNSTYDVGIEFLEPFPTPPPWAPKAA
jgi:PilZ domain-containing protein